VINIRVRGVQKLRALARTLEDPQKFLVLASQDGAEEALNLISEGFKAGSDPYGKGWGAPNNLQITGGIKDYTEGRIGADGFVVHSTDQKAIWHHAPQPRAAWGGKALPTRLQVPTAAQGLPAAWKEQLSEAMEDVIAYAIRKAARRTG
jgi:hypothetical protein